MRFFFFICLFFFPYFFSYADNLIKKEAKVYREKGYNLQTKGELDEALANYQKAVQIDPYFAPAYNDLGVVYEALGNDDEALAMYKKALKLNPQYLPVYTNLALFYEKKGSKQEAISYWKKRYEFSQEEDYWQQVSRQHLIRLGAYPQIEKQILEEKAAKLSKIVANKHNQERLNLIKEADLHFNIGKRAFHEGDYKSAMKEFEAVLVWNPPDENLLNKTRKLYQQSQRLYLRKTALSYTENALDRINNNDYWSAQEKLRNALATVSRIAQEK